jgi:hypothetical protein
LDAYGDGWTDILFFTPATTDDPLWNFTPDGGIQKHNEHTSGDWQPVAGDFFGDGYDDIFWFGSASSLFWDWEGALHPVSRPFGVS